MRTVTLPLLLLLAQLALSQTPAGRYFDLNQHLWYSYSGDHAVSKRWGVHLDAQWRRTDLATEWQQYQVRPGVNYSLNPSTQLTLGYAYTKSYPYGDFPARGSTPEHRIYQQYQKKHGWARAAIQHRVRMEQRFIRYPDSQSHAWTYQNRFRYMLRTEFPLIKETNGTAAWYLPIFNEVLIGIPPNYGARAFDQNRLFLGLGKSLPGAKLEVGYMKQFIGQRNGRIFEVNNTVFVTVTSSVSLSGLWGD